MRPHLALAGDQRWAQQGTKLPMGIVLDAEPSLGSGRSRESFSPNLWLIKSTNVLEEHFSFQKT